MNSSLRAKIAALAVRGASRDAALELLIERETDMTIAEKREAVEEYERVSSLLAERDRLASVASAKALWMMSVLRRLERQGGTDRVDEVHSLDATCFFRDYYFRNRPVIVRGMTRLWNEFEGWRLARLRERFGDRTVEVTVNRRRTPDHDVGTDAELQPMRLETYARMLDAQGERETNEFYMTARNHAMQNGLRRLLDDLEPLPGILTRCRPEQCNLWVGPNGTTTYLHHDVTNVLFVQIEGRKRITLIPPSHTSHVYNYRGVFSEIDAENPDFAAFPLFALCPITSVKLEEGDGLFIPVGWWHQVTSLSRSVSASFLNFVYDNVFSVSEFSRFG